MSPNAPSIRQPNIDEGFDNHHLDLWFWSEYQKKFDKVSLDELHERKIGLENNFKNNFFFCRPMYDAIRQEISLTEGLSLKLYERMQRYIKSSSELHEELKRQLVHCHDAFEQAVGYLFLAKCEKVIYELFWFVTRQRISPTVQNLYDAMLKTGLYH
ncbi:DgyrCDS14177 [Dimorphilus gyrociliatus]|uniref:DgyrCDS14177 n=1 Tax=Dimorphilus gyrociliatus TaxID=2664684 RepID=A0A7I8WCU1_9ANNE|nr:DgyrCDS14177 [Dimorphilus gyrociliatus]